MATLFNIAAQQVMVVLPAEWDAPFILAKDAQLAGLSSVLSEDSAFKCLAGNNVNVELLYTVRYDMVFTF